MADTTRRYGLLLPHFGEFASRNHLIKGAQRAEAYGFDSVWVRDHIVFHPHGMEGQDRTHVDPFVALSLVAGATDRLILGTGSLIPHRNPIHTALLLASLEYVAGRGRVIAGWGLGTFDHEFNAIGMAGWSRRDVLQEQVEIFRKLWTGATVSHQGHFYQFADVDIRPIPSSGTIPTWYCGGTTASVRRAVEYCDGWMPGRIPLNTFAKRVERLRQLSAEAGRETPTVAAIPITSPARTREEALARVNWQGMLAGRKEDWEPPMTGSWESPDALEGALIAGPPDYVVEVTRKLQTAGLSHLVYDLRFRFADWFECIDLLGQEVLPELRRGDRAAATTAAAAAG